MKPPGGAHLGLRVWTSPSGAGSLSYCDLKGYRVAAGEPRVADSPSSHSAALSGLFREFESACRAVRRRPLYFGLPAPALKALDPVPASAGMTGARGRWHAGDLPVFDLARWADPASVPASIRSQARRARNRGVTVRRLASAPAASDPAGIALRACLRAWLESKSLPPMGFVTSPFLFDPWPEQGVFIAERGGEIAGFLTASLALFPGLWRVDAVARAPDAPNGCAELLVSEAFRYAAECGYAQGTLGLAPLARRSRAGLTGGASSHWMDRVAEAVLEAGAPGYSFAGLETFKAKFHPEEWRPLYCVSGGGRLSLRDVLAVARAFAGGSLVAYGVSSLLWKFGKRRLRI